MSVDGVYVPNFGLVAMEKLCVNLLLAFAILNPFRGHILNMLAFILALLA
jgi:hypothetical protein